VCQSYNLNQWFERARLSSRASINLSGCVSAYTLYNMGSSFNEKVFRLIYLIKLRGLETKVNYLVDWNGRKKVKNH